MTHLKENAKGKALNSLGRSTGRKFNMSAIKREFAMRHAASSKFDARVFEVKRQKRDRKPVTLTF